jgi:hypothetical protein
MAFKSNFQFLKKIKKTSVMQNICNCTVLIMASELATNRKGETEQKELETFRLLMMADVRFRFQSTAHRIRV